jgi:hypothetical protein
LLIVLVIASPGRKSGNDFSLVNTFSTSIARTLENLGQVAGDTAMRVRGGATDV